MTVYTMQDWAKDGTFSAVKGQEVSEDIYNEFYNMMPIQRLKEAHGCTAGFRTTEPYSHESGKAVYMAFGKRDGKYYYLGLQ